MNLCVFTTVIGEETDPLRKPKLINSNVDYLCFTDQPIESKGWRIIPTESGDDSCLRSRRIKILANEVWDNFDASIWIDAAFELCVDPVLIVERWLYHADMLALKHPDRTRIDAEADEIIRLGKAPCEKVQNQVREYRDFSQSQQFITCTGLCARRHAPRVRRFCKTWWHELCRFGHCRDQMSVDYAASICEIDIKHIEGHYRDNPYARWFKL